jgi:SAM-dependent methyltransferase
MITRWETWFGDDNLAQDPRILAAPPSCSAGRAADAFLARAPGPAGRRRVLDLACGVGRDTFYLEGRGLRVVGVDAAESGVRVAQQRRRERGAAAAFLAADARHLPFRDGAFQGVYCFGLLHEFTGPGRQADVARVMAEVRRLLCPGGLLVLTVLAGEPEAGLPAVQLFTRPMFDAATGDLQAIEIDRIEDVGCTNRPDYDVWYGLYER